MKMEFGRNAKVSLTAIAGLLLLIGAAIAASDTASTTASVSVNEFLSVTLTNDPVAFGSMDPGTTANANPGSGYPLTVTIGSESNVNGNVATRANTDSFTGPGSLTVDNMEWSPDGSSAWTGYTTSDATVCSGVSPGSTCDIYHRLTIPGGTTAGSYSTGITVTASS